MLYDQPLIVKKNVHSEEVSHVLHVLAKSHWLAMFMSSVYFKFICIYDLLIAERML